ncbi:MAG: HNH endonuclease signature motif containing protein [Trueperaceae bacterium]|nr:HNH endonuclease signature motif containing protein [Trueperaceae bacterium]
MKYRAIYRRDDDTCQYCGNGASSVDHLLPKTLGGTDRADNLVCSCGTCNRLKAETHYPDLVESMRFLIVRGRTCKHNFAPLYWQAQTLDLLCEPLDTNPNEGRWFERTLTKLIFTEPNVPGVLHERSYDVAVTALVEKVPGVGEEEGEGWLEHLALSGWLWVVGDIIELEAVDLF